MPRNKSSASAKSYGSVLSDDSYLATFKPGIDDQFREMLENITLIENNRTILMERKIQSHEAKKRDPNDTQGRADWTPEMDADYRSYKGKANALGAAKKVLKKSDKNAEKRQGENIETLREKRYQELNEEEAWMVAAIE